MAINISSSSKGIGRALSNFAATPFEIDGVRCASAEGFIQALKFPDPEEQRKVCRLVGLSAKLRGRLHAHRLRCDPHPHVWWLGREIPFRSPEHFALIERALRAKFTQSRRAKSALLASGNATLTHDPGKPERRSPPCRPSGSLPCCTRSGRSYRLRFP
jgi:predicted NAD-dependent protein-ADP-ribosyltransferase YbiA (DUF1768 family)